LLFIFVRLESKIADFHKALGKNMQQETSNKLIAIKSHFLGFIIFPVPAVGKGNFTV
jgi:hypothetical protein